MARGGARPGAGRKKKAGARVVLSCRVASETMAELERRAQQQQVGIGVLIDNLIN